MDCSGITSSSVKVTVSMYSSPASPVSKRDGYWMGTKHAPMKNPDPYVTCTISPVDCDELVGS